MYDKLLKKHNTKIQIIDSHIQLFVDNCNKYLFAANAQIIAL